MNRSRRVLLIGRHFWPHGSIDSAACLVGLACGLYRHGVNVEVCTPRYASSWTDKFWFREIPVHRPVTAPRSDWSIGRYTRHLTQWLRQNANQYDAILVDSIREEAIAAIEASRSTGSATILKYAGHGPDSDARYWTTSRAARRCGSIGKMADAVIVRTAECSRALIADRYAADRVCRIASGFSAAASRSTSARNEARETLAAVNSDLRAGGDTLVAICTAPMTRESGINDLVRATHHLVEQFPNLQVWFLGDGPNRESIYDQLRGDGVRASIAMPGSFSDFDDVFAAADIYIQTDDSGLEHFLPAAVSAELPIVAVADEPVRTALIGQSNRAVGSGAPNHCIRWIDEPTPTGYLAAVADVIDDLPQRRKNASILRRHWLRERPLSATMDDYVRLIDRTVAKKAGGARNRSAEAIP